MNDGWSTFGLKSKNAEPPKPKPYPCSDCSSSFLLKRNLQSHRKNTRFLYEKTAPKKIKKRNREEQKSQLKDLHHIIVLLLKSFLFK